MEELKMILRQFRDERDWAQYHTPENLAKSVSIEAGELLECFQWGDDYDRHAVSDELADVLCYVIMLADTIGVDLKEETLRKISENAVKYPVEKSRSRSDKYTAL